MPPEKKKLFQLVNMLHMKTFYNIKNMLISNMHSQNQNVQYHEVQISSWKSIPWAVLWTSLKAGFMAMRFVDEIVVAFMAYNMHSYQNTTQVIPSVRSWSQLYALGGAEI